MSSNWPCIECGANEMGYCGKVGCSAMEDQLAEKNIEIARLRIAISDSATEAHNHYQPQIDECIKEINAGNAYALELSALLRAAKCPNRPRCDNKGVIAYYGAGGRLEQEPCEWCAKRDAALAKNPSTGAVSGLRDATGARTTGSDSGSSAPTNSDDALTVQQREKP